MKQYEEYTYAELWPPVLDNRSITEKQKDQMNRDRPGMWEWLEEVFKESVKE